MRIALVHDALVNRGGAERVAATLCRAFPDAPLYTTVYLADRTYDAFRGVDVRPSPLQRVVRSERALKAVFPLALLAMDRLRLPGVDAVLSSSTFAAKFVRTAGAPHICYCYTPFRLAWDPDAYARPAQGPLRRSALRGVAALTRGADRQAARRVDRFLTMTETTRKRIRAAYGRDAAIIPPPIDCSRYAPAPDQRTERFLLVSRLEPYKRVDVVIEAFNRLALPLLVIGDGSEAARLRASAGPTITFRSGVGDAELRHEYARSRALLFPQLEDYGLVPLEAIASGTPVIAYGAGGVLETMVPARTPADAAHATAVFFPLQTPDAVVEAVSVFERCRFDPEVLRARALQFDEPAFIERIRAAVGEAIAQRSGVAAQTPLQGHP